MLNKILSRVLGSDVWKVVGLIGGIGGLKYGYDSVNDWYQEKVLIVKENELINNVKLSENDKKAIQLFEEQKGNYNELTERQMKEIKYEYYKKRQEQIIQEKIDKVRKEFEGDFDDFNNKNIQIRIKQKD